MAGIVTEDLALPDDMQSLEVIYRGLCKLPDRVDEYGKIVSSKRRRLDFLSVPWKHRGAALLYYTVGFFIPRTTIKLSSLSLRATIS